jgi:hypothetical protein
MDFKSYLAAAERTYSYRVKTVVPLDDVAMGHIERAVAKYNPLEIGKVSKTILQKEPLDFAEVQNAEVYIIDMTLGLPASAYVLQQDFRNALGIPEEYIKVRSANDPIEVEQQYFDAVSDMDAEAAAMGMRPAPLLVQPDYPEANKVDAADLYGDVYNKRFLDYLHTVAKNRPDPRVNAPHPITRWENQPEPDATDNSFNDNIKDIVVPASDKKSGSGKFKNTEAPHGNFDSDGETINRLYTDGTKTKLLSRTVTPIRKGDL